VKRQRQDERNKDSLLGEETAHFGAVQSRRPVVHVSALLLVFGLSGLWDNL